MVEVVFLYRFQAQGHKDHCFKKSEGDAGKRVNKKRGGSEHAYCAKNIKKVFLKRYTALKVCTWQST
jgi:hypothetical protein